MVGNELETVAKEGKSKTLFTPRQLDIMRALFEINKYPDNSEYEMLSKETNLTKNVLRV